MAEITDLIGRARGGDAEASERLFASLYSELHHVAVAQLRGDPAMRATSLVHESYLKIARHGALAVNDREHFVSVAARAMRQIVIDHARARAAQRRGGDVQMVSLDTNAIDATAQGREEDVLALDAALGRLAEVDPALAKLVELRFYGGLDLAAIAAITERGERSLKRDWRRARAFLRSELGGHSSETPALDTPHAD